MRRFASLILLVMVFVCAGIVHAATAEVVVMDIPTLHPETEKLEETASEREEALSFSAEGVTLEETDVLPPVDQPQANRSVVATSTEKLIYTCPVRKTDVYVTWDYTYGPTSVYVRFERLVNGGWENCGSTEISAVGNSCTLRMAEPARYRVYITKAAGLDGKCGFLITAAVSSDS